MSDQEKQDREWAEQFVGCKIEGTGRSFASTVEILARKLTECRNSEAIEKVIFGLEHHREVSFATNQQWAADLRKAISERS